MSRPKIITLNGGTYKQKSEIGSGGFGKVFLIENKITNQEFAYKVQEHQDYDFGEHEAKIMKDLENINIVKVFDYGLGKDNKTHWYLMEYTKLGSLRNLIGQKLDLVGICNLFLQILNGLKYIHDKGYYHRDLKPDNILIFDGSILKITDFGLVKKIDESTRSVISFKGSGTNAYMAPELFECKHASVKSDIYALGVLFFEMLSGGQAPYKTETVDWFNIHNSVFRYDISEFRKDIDWSENWRMANMLKKMNKTNLNDRYNSCDEIIKEINNFLAKSDSFIPESLLLRSNNIHSEAETKEIEEKIRNQDFENQNEQIISQCKNFVDVLINTVTEFNRQASIPLQVSEENNGLYIKSQNRFLSFCYDIVCDTLVDNDKYLNYKPRPLPSELGDPNLYYISEMYKTYKIVASAFLRIGKMNERDWDFDTKLYRSSSWGCNFLLQYNIENKEFVWIMVKNSFSPLVGSYQKYDSFSIRGIGDLMRFGSRYFMPMSDIIQNSTSVFALNEKNIVQFLKRLIN